ncbi:MAG: hypothetical protein ACWGQW_21900, partial [bacterium]
MNKRDHSVIDAMVNMREAEVEETARQILEEGGDPLRLMEQCREAMGIVGTSIDITEHVQLEAQLRQAQKMD